MCEVLINSLFVVYFTYVCLGIIHTSMVGEGDEKHCFDFNKNQKVLRTICFQNVKINHSILFQLIRSHTTAPFECVSPSIS